MILWAKPDHQGLKVVLQILTRQFYKNTKKSSLYSQSFLIFIHKTPIVENHPTTRDIRELLQPRSTPTGITVYFKMSSLFIYILEIHSRKFRTQRLMKRLWKIITYLLCYGIKASLVTWFSHNAFFFFPGAKSENNLRGYVAFSRDIIKKKYSYEFFYS